MSDSPTLRFQRKRKRWPFVLAGLVVLMIVAWQVIERTVDVDSYRPLLIDRIAKYTGLPATIDSMDFALFPVPSIRAQGVTVGEGDFMAVCSQLSAEARLSSLVRGVVDVGELNIADLVVVLPRTPGELKERVDGIRTAYDDSSPRKDDDGKKGSSRISFAIGRINAPGATITLNGAETPVFRGDAAATNVLSKVITIIADADAPAYGDEARIAGTMTLDRNGVDGVGLGVNGDFNLTAIDTATLFNVKHVPDAMATAHMVLERTGPRQFRIDVDGNAQPVESQESNLDAIAGEFRGVGWWDSGQITLNNLAWNAPGVTFTTDITVQPDGAVATSVKEISANQDALKALLSAQPKDSYRLAASDDAQLNASDMLVGVTAEKKLRLAGGSATFSGLNLLLPDGTEAVRGIAGELALEEDAIRITSLDATGLSLRGTVTLDADDGTASINLSGQVDLTRERLGMLMPLDVVKDAKGTVKIEKVVGTFGSGRGMPEDFSITGALSDGIFDIASEAWTDSLRGMSAKFTATPGAVDTKASASSEKLGAVNIDGKYTIKDRNWTGTARGNLGKMDLPFLKQEAAKKVAPGILRAYGDSAFSIALELPTEKRTRMNVAFERDGSPKLQGNVAMLSLKSGWTLGDVQVDATLPGDALQPILPTTMHVRGLVPIAFRRTTDPAVFDAKINLTGNTVELSDYLTKREGVNAVMDVDGVAATGNWAAKDVAITMLDQTIKGRFTEKRFEVPAFDISAGALAALMPEGTRAGGRIRGTFATQPVVANVELAQVNFALNDQLGVEHLDGGVSYNNGIIATENLAVRGANSDFTVDLVSKNGGWSGALTGSQLDVNAVLAMRTALEAQSPAGTAEGEPSAGSESGFKGTFDINMGTVFYKEAVFNNVFTNVKFADGQTELGNLSFANREGKASGWVRLGKATAMSLKLEGVDQALLDDLVFEEPRGLKGPMWGTVDLEIPSGESRPILSGTNGTVKVSSTDGTFGKLGMATKILSALRTLEITRLRAPKLKDQGLAYDACDIEASFTDGMMTLSTANLKTPSYVITALGTINFNAQQSDVLVHVDLMETVLGPTESIPGLGDVIGMFRNTGGFRILLTGNPVDPEMKYGFGPKPGSITDDVREAVTDGDKIAEQPQGTDKDAIRDEIIGRAAEALKGLLEKK